MIHCHVTPADCTVTVSLLFWTVNTLTASSAIFDALVEVDTKFAKLVQKEYDASNDICSKAFKKIRKEEVLHDETLNNLDFRLKKASATYEKRMRASNPSMNATSYEHDKHIHLLASLNAEMNSVKFGHSANMRHRRDAVLRQTAKTLATVAEHEWKRYCEATRTIGSGIGRLLSWSNLLLCEAPVIPTMPDDLEFPTASYSRSPEPLHSPTFPSNQVQTPASFPSPHYRTIRPDLSPRLPPEFPVVHPKRKSAFSDSPSLTSTQVPQVFARGDYASLASRERPLSSSAPGHSFLSSSANVNTFTDSGTGHPSEYTSVSSSTPLAQPEASPVPSEDGTSQGTSDSFVAVDRSPQPAGVDFTVLTSKFCHPAVPNQIRSVSAPTGFVMEETEEWSLHEHAATVERSLSVESTESQQSFVQKMKARYLQEKQAKTVCTVFC